MTDLSKYRENLVQLEEVYFPKTFEGKRPMKEHIARIRQLDLRNDDVIMCAFPKTGTHWVWEVGSMLLAGKSETRSSNKIHAMLEANDVEDLEALPSPRLLNTHMPIRMLPYQIKEKRTKLIHVYRNVKDVYVSMYFHYSQRPNSSQLTIRGSMEELFNAGITASGNYFTYLKNMNAFMKENPEIPVFNMSYEEMMRDTVSMISKLAAFLEVKASAEVCADLAEACSFQNMKTAEQFKESAATKKWPAKKINIYRKGEVGDWKNYLTVAQSERFDSAMEQLDNCNFHFQYTL